jgi:hypothetical protein
MRQAARCRVTTAPQLARNTRWARPHGWENSRRGISRRHGPNFSFSQKRRPAAFCSIVPARIAFFVSPAWNETDIRCARSPSLSPAQPTRNDSRLRTRNRSQPKLPRSVRLHSCSLSNRSRSPATQTFSAGGSTAGATAPEAIPSGGMAASLDSIGFSLGWPNCGCSTRVASNIAVNSNTAAR